MHERHFSRVLVSVCCRRWSCRLLGTLMSSFRRTSPTTERLLGLYSAVPHLSSRSLLCTLFYLYVINVVHLTNLSILHITPTGRTKLLYHAFCRASKRAWLGAEEGVWLGKRSGQKQICSAFFLKCRWWPPDRGWRRIWIAATRDDISGNPIQSVAAHYLNT